MAKIGEDKYVNATRETSQATDEGHPGSFKRNSVEEVLFWSIVFAGFTEFSSLSYMYGVARRWAQEMHVVATNATFVRKALFVSHSVTRWFEYLGHI